MDPRIEALRSTTFFGRRLTRQQISEIQATAAGVFVAEPIAHGTSLGRRFASSWAGDTHGTINRVQSRHYCHIIGYENAARNVLCRGLRIFTGTAAQRGERRKALPRLPQRVTCRSRRPFGQRLRCTEGSSRKQNRKNEARFLRARLLQVPPASDEISRYPGTQADRRCRSTFASPSRIRRDQSLPWDAGGSALPLRPSSRAVPPRHSVHQGCSQPRAEATRIRRSSQQSEQPAFDEARATSAAGALARYLLRAIRSRRPA